MRNRLTIFTAVLIYLMSISPLPRAMAASPEQTQFENNVFVFPNPVRGGIGTIHVQAIRDGASISIRIYTISGTLVRDVHFDNLAAASITNFPWNALNQSGQKVGRGLYLFVVRETDPVGVLETTKKAAVIQ